MKRLLILMALLAAAALAWGVSHWYIARRVPDAPLPPADPLAWMQTELHIDDATLAKVRALHESYQPVCGEKCLAIAKANSRVSKLQESSRRMTPELESAIREAKSRRADCHIAMLSHIYETVALLPPEAAQHYLRVVTARMEEDGLCLAEVTEKQP